MLLLVENLFQKNPLQDLLSSLNTVISTDESTHIVTGHVIYNLVYTYKFQLKTTYVSYLRLVIKTFCYNIKTKKLCLRTHYPKLNMKNRASDNEGKFHWFLMCRIWIYSQNLIPSKLGWIWHIEFQTMWEDCNLTKPRI